MAFLLTWLHATLSVYELPDDDPDEFKDALYGFEILSSTARRTSRHDFARDLAISNCETMILTDYCRVKPTAFGAKVLSQAHTKTGLYTDRTTASRYRDAGFDFVGLFPTTGSLSWMDLERKARTAPTRAPFIGMNPTAYMEDGSSRRDEEESGTLRVDAFVQAYVSKIDHFIDQRFIRENLQLIRNVDQETPGYPFERVKTRAHTRIRIGKRSGSVRLSAAAKVAENTLKRDARDDGDEDLVERLNVFIDNANSSHHYFEDNLDIDLRLIKDELSNLCPHYKELVFTRALSCPTENQIDGKVIKIGDPSRYLLGDGDGMVTGVRPICPLSFGTDEKSSGTLRLPGPPDLNPKFLAEVMGQKADGRRSSWISYITSPVKAVQRKLGGIQTAVLELLKAKWGGYDLIPEERIEAVAGKPLDEALSIAMLKSGKPKLAKVQKEKTDTDILLARIDRLERGISKPRNKVSKKKSSKKPGKGSKYRHKDPKVVQKVASAFGTSDFKGIMRIIKSNVGEGKFDIPKLAKFFRGGKFSDRVDAKKKALALKIN
jgi:hypothetical protein